MGIANGVILFGNGLKMDGKFKKIGLMIGAIILLTLLAASVITLSRPSFGRLPRGARLARIERSPNYREGMFRNRRPTPLFTSDRGRLGTMLGMLFRKAARIRPAEPLPVVKTDPKRLYPSRDVLVWFGHSSYLLQTSGLRILVDPVFCIASPVSFVNRPFAGTNVWEADDMPAIDYLVITHDHWDHLDYRTVMRLKDRIGCIVCPLGVGEHFEYWGFDPVRIMELDWNETQVCDERLLIHCLPARHFSGRGLVSNRTLWASFLLETPDRKIYIGGDGGYDDRFGEIGERFGGVDLAVLENGQYSQEWKYMHMMPDYLLRAARELGAKRVLTVHHSKYALAGHPWDEPLENALRAAETDSLEVIVPMIGQIVYLGEETPAANLWWRR